MLIIFFLNNCSCGRAVGDYTIKMCFTLDFYVRDWHIYSLLDSCNFLVVSEFEDFESTTLPFLFKFGLSENNQGRRYVRRKLLFCWTYTILEHIYLYQYKIYNLKILKDKYIFNSYILLENTQKKIKTTLTLKLNPTWFSRDLFGEQSCMLLFWRNYSLYHT